MIKIAQKFLFHEVSMSLFQYLSVSLFCSLLMIQNASAAPFPRGCEITGFGYNQNVLVLNETGEQSFYLIQNRSESKIELERQNTDESFMSPPLFATLEPMNWGAFASDVKYLNFKCYKHDNENTSLTACRDVLEVCQYPRVKFALSNMGNYWISSNKTQYETIQDAVAKGIYLKW